MISGAICGTGGRGWYEPVIATRHLVPRTNHFQTSILRSKDAVEIDEDGSTPPFKILCSELIPPHWLSVSSTKLTEKTSIRLNYRIHILERSVSIYQYWANPWARNNYTCLSGLKPQ